MDELKTNGEDIELEFRKENRYYLRFTQQRKNKFLKSKSNENKKRVRVTRSKKRQNDLINFVQLEKVEFDPYEVSRSTLMNMSDSQVKSFAHMLEVFCNDHVNEVVDQKKSNVETSNEGECKMSPTSGISEIRLITNEIDLL